MIGARIDVLPEALLGSHVRERAGDARILRALGERTAVYIGCEPPAGWVPILEQAPPEDSGGTGETGTTASGDTGVATGDTATTTKPTVPTDTAPPTVPTDTTTGDTATPTADTAAPTAETGTPVDTSETADTGP